jgi:hypothetical protein
MRALMFLMLLLWSIPAGAEEYDYNLTKVPEVQGWMRKIVERSGLNCPIPIRQTSAGEDHRGKKDKIDCTTKDGSKSWSLRKIAPPGHVSRVEPW